MQRVDVLVVMRLPSAHRTGIARHGYVMARYQGSKRRWAPIRAVFRQLRLEQALVGKFVLLGNGAQCCLLSAVHGYDLNQADNHADDALA